MTQEERYLLSDIQNITLEVEYPDASILDIGGGGEGFIGKLYGKNVISIDRSEKELLETRNESIKLVMEAAKLQFTNNNFDVVTLFFALMYMDTITKVKVLEEATRVLKPGGIVDIWDIEIPEYKGEEKDIFVARLRVDCPGEYIETGYGVRYEGHSHSTKFLDKIMLDKGFNRLREEKFDQSFRLQYIKSEDNN